MAALGARGTALRDGITQLSHPRAHSMASNPGGGALSAHSFGHPRFWGGRDEDVTVKLVDGEVELWKGRFRSSLKTQVESGREVGKFS